MSAAAESGALANNALGSGALQRAPTFSSSFARRIVLVFIRLFWRCYPLRSRRISLADWSRVSFLLGERVVRDRDKRRLVRNVAKGLPSSVGKRFI